MRFKKGDRFTRKDLPHMKGTIMTGRLPKSTRLVKGDIFYVHYDGDPMTQACLLTSPKMERVKK